MHPEVGHKESILVKGCDLLASPGDLRSGIDIATRSGIIESIGHELAFEAGGPAKVIDGRGLIAMPGLVNAHTHSPENCLRGVGEGLQLEPWLLRMFGTSGLFSPEDHHVCALAGAVEMLLLGVTTVVDHLWMTPPGLDAIGGAVKAYEESGIRAGVAPLVNDRDHTFELADSIGFDLGPASLSGNVLFPETGEALDVSEEAIRKWHGTAGGRVSVLCGPGGLQWCSDELLTGLAEIAGRHETGVHMHLHETDQQQACSQIRFGKSGVAGLNELGVLGKACSLPHSVWITPEDIELLAESGSSVVHNPSANLRLGSGRCPVPSLLDRGVNVALGTDGSASSDNQNLWEITKLAALIHNDGDRWVSGADALKMATVAGEQVLAAGYGESGAPGAPRLSEGSTADLILLDSKSDNLAGCQELEPTLALAETGNSVRHVIVNGRLVVEDGRCLTVDADQVRLALAEQVAKRRSGVAAPPASTVRAIGRMKAFNESLRHSATTLSNQEGGVTRVQV